MAQQPPPKYAHANYERMILITADEYAKLLDCEKEYEEKHVTFADPLESEDESPKVPPLRIKLPPPSRIPLRVASKNIE